VLRRAEQEPGDDKHASTTDNTQTATMSADDGSSGKTGLAFGGVAAGAVIFFMIR
jgi:hypothetical protein